MAANGFALRWANRLDQGELRLRFWARFDSLEAEDSAFVWVGSDGVNSTFYSLFSEDKNDNAWHFYDLAVPVPEGADLVFVRFQAQMDPRDDLWHIDDVELGTPLP